MAARQPHVVATISLALIAFCIFSPRRTFFDNRSYNLDEGTTAVCARVLMEGGVLYRDVVDSRPPLTHCFYALMFKLFGLYNMKAVHISLAVILVAVSMLLYAIASRAAGWRAGVFAGLLFAVASFNYVSWDILAFHTEWLMILFTSCAGYCVIRGLWDGRNRWFAAGGLLYALAVFCKQPAITDFGAAALFLVLQTARRAPEGRADALKRLACLAGTFAAVALAFALYFFLNGALKEFWFWCWTYNVRYHVGAVPPIDRMLAFITNLYADSTYLHDNAVLMLLTATFVVWRRRWENQETHAKPVFRFLSIWAVFSYIGSSLSGRGPGWGHYFFQVLPAFCVAGGVMIEIGVRQTRRWTGIRPESSFYALFLFLIFMFPALVLWNSNDAGPKPMVPRLFPWIYPHSTIRRSLSESLGPPGMTPLTIFLKDEADPEDTLFVWGFSPEVYVRTLLRPATRFVYCNPLTGLIPWINVDPSIDTRQYIIPGMWELVMRDLDKNRPKFIIDASVGNMSYKKYPTKYYPELQNFIDRYYSFDKEMEGRWRIYRRKE